MKYLTIIVLLTLSLSNTSCDSASHCREYVIRENALMTNVACSLGAKISIEVINGTTYFVCKCGERKQVEDEQLLKTDAGDAGDGGDSTRQLLIFPPLL